MIIHTLYCSNTKLCHACTVLASTYTHNGTQVHGMKRISAAMMTYLTVSENADIVAVQSALHQL